MHILAPNQTIEKYPYSIGELRRDNPNTSFPRNPDDALLAEWGVFPVQPTDYPTVDHTKNVSEASPVLQNGAWVRVWNVTDASAEEIAERLEQQRIEAKANRYAAYTTESDPLFFKWQAGEATQSEWQAKRDEIKANFPYPVQPEPNAG